MKWTLALFLVMLSANMLADAVRWGGATFTNRQLYDEILTHNVVDGAELQWLSSVDNGMAPPSYNLQGSFSVTRANGKTTIGGVGHILAFSTVFVQVDVGETVSLLTTFYAPEALLAFGYRPGEEEIPANSRYCSDYGIEVPSYGTQIFYLGFGVEGITTETENPEGFEAVWLYGWLEIAVNGTELSVVNSAIGLNGQSMTVGLIPEPSAAALLLIGLAPLALRRRPESN